MWHSLQTLTPELFDRFARIGTHEGSIHVDYPSLFSMLARSSEGDRHGMEQLLFAVENAHPTHIPAIMEGLNLYSALTPVNKNSMSNVEVI